MSANTVVHSHRRNEEATFIGRSAIDRMIFGELRSGTSVQVPFTDCIMTGV
jgi:hypothetical protein